MSLRVLAEGTKDESALVSLGRLLRHEPEGSSLVPSSHSYIYSTLIAFIYIQVYAGCCVMSLRADSSLVPSSHSYIYIYVYVYIYMYI